MLLAALRDLQWRRKRFAITLLGTGLVFAMSLLMSGLANAFTVAIDRTLADQHVQLWVANGSASGPYSAGFAITPAMIDAVRAMPGVRAADGLVSGRTTARVPRVVQVNLFGVAPGGITGVPRATHGSNVLRPGGVVVPEQLGRSVGATVQIGTRSFKVIGVVSKASLVIGATVFLTARDAQLLLLGGQPLTSLILVRGHPSGPWPMGLEAFDRASTREDLLRPLLSVNRSIDFLKVLLWAVAGMIVGSVVFLTALERTRDIAVFKATGAKTWQIGGGICLQAIILAVSASVLGAVIAVLIAPVFPMDVAVSGRSLLLLPLLAVIVGLLSALVGVRRTATVQPATAFGGP